MPEYIICATLIFSGIGNEKHINVPTLFELLDEVLEQEERKTQDNENWKTSHAVSL